MLPTDRTHQGLEWANENSTTKDATATKFRYVSASALLFWNEGVNQYRNDVGAHQTKADEQSGFQVTR